MHINTKPYELYVILQSRAKMHVHFFSLTIKHQAHYYTINNDMIYISSSTSFMLRFLSTYNLGYKFFQLWYERYCRVQYKPYQAQTWRHMKQEEAWTHQTLVLCYLLSTVLILLKFSQRLMRVSLVWQADYGLF